MQNLRWVACFSSCEDFIAHPFLWVLWEMFGFKKQHSRDMCIFTLKCVIKYFTRQNTPVFLCFLGASNAFDRVNHWKLFRKLIIGKVPLVIVRMLIFWYSKQEMCIKWGQATSDYFTISNGVRQDGILSPRLFAVYVDDLSKQLVDCQI